MTIPAEVRAGKALNRHEQYQGSLPFAQMARLQPLLAQRDGALEVALEAGRDTDGAARLHGRVRGTLQLTCQRGLHPYDWPCDLPIDLRLAFDEAEEERLARDYEPYLVHDDRLPLREIVEDEVLLALPMMPRCDDTGCVERLK